MGEHEVESNRSLLDACRALRDEVARIIQSSRDKRRRLTKLRDPAAAQSPVANRVASERVAVGEPKGPGVS